MWIFLLLGGPFVGDHGEPNKLIDDYGAIEQLYCFSKTRLIVSDVFEHC